METVRQKGSSMWSTFIFKSEGDILKKVQITQLNAGIHYKTDFKMLNHTLGSGYRGKLGIMH